ncbi:proline-rich receptor-like protein kinase PERK9 [Iris pallida]|uniref:Proline-rich receptor-like protein kinase PERK9 n=1 Tax=Iris pallida TaxID=29817 RepID=A0AAX6DVE7_IRIPA|nr:proline-rich receptor-like protein kinase PERK9 [Iris pallida]
MVLRPVAERGCGGGVTMVSVVERSGGPGWHDKGVAEGRGCVRHGGGTEWQGRQPRVRRLLWRRWPVADAGKEQRPKIGLELGFRILGFCRCVNVLDVSCMTQVITWWWCPMCRTQGRKYICKGYNIVERYPGRT